MRMEFSYRTTLVERATRLSAIVADSLVLIFTWAKTYTNVREAMKLALNVKVTTCLLRDGTSI